ncbi:MAG: DUF7601 domain-containing protein [Bacillota bacterium]
MKILAVVFTLMLTIGMSSAVFAESSLSGGTAGSSDDPAGNTVTLEKALKVTNNSGYGAYATNITYTYTLSKFTGSGSVSDGTTTVNFKPGELSYLAQGSTAAVDVEYSNTESTTSGQNISKDVSWTFNPAAFPSAGVYRYVVTETSDPADVSSVGIERPSGYNTTKYLDVYVQNVAGGGLEIYGYALVNTDTTVTDQSAKSDGWNDGDDLDSYTTYNITITNTIDGTGADLTSEWQFTVTLGGDYSNANIDFGGTGDVSYDAEHGIVSGTLGNGETLVINGLPNTATFDITEKNPTSDTYQVTADVSGITGTTDADGDDIAGGATEDVSTGGNLANATGAISIGVTNYLGTISPTNVIMRFAPFLFIFGAAILLLAVMRKRKTHES